MILAPIFALLLIAGAVGFVLKTKTDKPPDFKIAVNLETEVIGEEVMVTLTFTNAGNNSASIEKRNGCLNGQIENNVFEITSGEQKIKYKGIMAKIAPPGPEGYLEIPAGQSVTATVKLNDVYDFLPGVRNYEIKYSAYHSLSVFLMHLESGKDYFTLYRGYTRLDLQYGESGKTKEGVNVEFVDIKSDSRCPFNLACYHSGFAVIKIKAFLEGTKAPSLPQELTIQGGWAGSNPLPNYMPPRQGNVLKIGDWSLVFARLEPYPIAGKETQKSSYKALFFVVPTTDIEDFLSGTISEEEYYILNQQIKGACFGDKGNLIIVEKKTSFSPSGYQGDEQWSRDLEITINYIKERLEGVEEETLNDFKEKNQRVREINAIFDSGDNKCPVISSEDKDETGNKEKETVIVSFSRVGFNSQKTQALLSVGKMSLSADKKLNGYGQFLLFEKENGVWVLKNAAQSWIT